MPRKPRVISATGYYHVVIRGVNHQIMFIDEQDYRFFLGKLRRCLEEEYFEVHAYCLMDNHVHLLIHADSGLDHIIKRVAGSYAIYFNRKYERCGHLYQERYSSEPVEDERYLLAVVRYIHNNPQKAGICMRNFYRWSSIQAYFGFPDSITATKMILQMTGGLDDFFEFSASNEEVECLDISEKKITSDHAVTEIIQNEFQVSSGLKLQEMDKTQKDEALQFLYNKGISVRKIERVTGINRKYITKITKLSS